MHRCFSLSHHNHSNDLMTCFGNGNNTLVGVKEKKPFKEMPRSLTTFVTGSFRNDEILIQTLRATTLSPHSTVNRKLEEVCTSTLVGDTSL